MQLSEFIATMNQWGSQQIPFLFLVDFEMKKPLIFRLSEIDPAQIAYNFNGVSNVRMQRFARAPLNLKLHPISREAFEEKFSAVMRQLEYGDTYLANLTVKSEIDVSATFDEIFSLSAAKYKLRLNNEFLCFSPETFVQIRDRNIFSFPMKGTIDAAIPDARTKLLSDKKELAEHITIVDLIRNDLSSVAENVYVSRFRYVDELKTNGKTLLQVSSEIAGELRENYLSALGDIITKLLPAGSVSGAPKPKTLQIIRTAEGEDRGYYTGVAGIFDGRQLDSGVMIRFVEQHHGKLFYRSGGGITAQSSMEKEYQEVIDKVYVPLA